MIRAATLSLLVLAMTAPASTAADLVGFWTPSKQIACAYVPELDESPAMLRCDLLFRNDRAVLLRTTGKARLIRITDTIADPDAKVLAYGKTWRHRGYTCLSRRTGLRCHRANGHGFFVSRERIALY